MDPSADYFGAVVGDQRPSGWNFAGYRFFGDLANYCDADQHPVFGSWNAAAITFSVAASFWNEANPLSTPTH